MAAIGKIRQHYGLLVVIIGVALLAFVFGDLLRSDRNHTVQQQKIATVNGEEVSSDGLNESKNIQDYYNKLQVFNNRVTELLLKKEYEELGINVTDKEFNDIFSGAIKSNLLASSFPDEKGGLDLAKLNQTYESIQNVDNIPEYSEEMKQSIKNNWLNLENEVVAERMLEKYFDIVKSGYYMPKKMADRYNENKNLSRKAEIYMVNYSTIPDSVLNLTEKDYKDYYEEYKYKQATNTEYRNIKFTRFEIKPTQKDMDSTFADVRDNVLPHLKETKDLGNLISFANENSDTKIDTSWKKLSEFPPVIENFVQNNDVDAVCEPFHFENKINVARIIDKKTEDGVVMAKVALLEREIKAGVNTINDVRQKALKFASEIKSVDQFMSSGVNVESADTYLTKETYGIFSNNSNKRNINTRSIVRWAFRSDVNVGSVEYFSIDDSDNGSYYVAILTEIIPEGYLPYDDVIDQDYEIIKKWKKGKIIAEKAKKYGNDYETMIAELGGEKKPYEVTFDNPKGEFSSEEKILGTIMGVKENVFSRSIQGGNMYAVVKVTESKMTGETKYDDIKTSNKAIYNNNVANYGAIINALRKNAEIENNITNFF